MLFRSNEIIAGNKIDITKIPTGTRVYVNTDLQTVRRNINPVIVLEQGQSIWSQVQAAYNDKDTCYLAPNSSDIVKGDKANFKTVGPGTRIILGCEGPKEIRRINTPIKIFGNRYNTEKAIYIFPTGEIKTGREIQNFNVLAKGTKALIRN